MSDHKERACAKCGSFLHHEDECPAAEGISPHEQWNRYCAEGSRIAKRPPQGVVVRPRDGEQQKVLAKAVLVQQLTDIRNRCLNEAQIISINPSKAFTRLADELTALLRDINETGS